MKRSLLFFLILICITTAKSSNIEQDTLNWRDYWLLQGKVYLHLSQGAQINWAKGGDNIFSSLIKTQFKTKYKKNKQIWDNTFNWNYGFLLVGVKEEQKVEKRNSDDYIEINSSYGYNAKGKFYYNALFNFKSQFFKGYKYPNDSVVVSNLLSPAYIIFSAGMIYKPSEALSVMVSPLTSKTTMVIKEGMVDGTQYGLKEDDRIYKEVGAYITINYKTDIVKNIKLENELTLFSNYQYKPENIDVELKSDFNFIINKNIKALLSLHFIYDDDAKIPVNKFVNDKYTQVGYTKGLQFQEKIMLGIGIDF
ncbi:MAG: DUF3078 domain-containing protein [Bacteroidales bacterium]|nr:DUF3078 domain-containing protein [Bacteroidales bacterium]